MQAGEFDDDEVEPPCPPGLRRLSAPLEAFATFLRVDRDLLDAAAAGSADAEEAFPAEEASRWVSGLPEAEKDALLLRLIEAASRTFAPSWSVASATSRTPAGSGATAGRRTVGELLARR